MKTKLTPKEPMGINNSCKEVGPDLSAAHYGYIIIDKPKDQAASNNLVDFLSHPSYRLHYVIQGSVSLYFNNKKVTLKKNSVFMLIPNTGIAYEAHTNHTSLYWITFNGLRAKHYCIKMGLTEEQPFVQLPDNKLLPYFYAPFTKKGYSPSMLNVVMHKSLLSIIEYLYANRISSTSSEAWQQEEHKQPQTYLQKILHYIDKKLSDPALSIKMFAEKLNVHPSTLSRLFKKEMSVCFTEYVTVKRCELAVSLLESGTHKVNEVARMVGFEDPLYFSRIYKKILGCSPMETIRTANALRKKDLL